MEHIRVSRDGAVGIITIDRPKRFNSFDVRTARDFRKAGLDLARDPEIRCAVVRGSGGVFSSGADLKYIDGGGDDGDLSYLHSQARPIQRGSGEVFRQILEYLHSTISEIRRAPKPFIAAVDGIAAAGGLGIALACDLVVASERSIFEYAYFKSALCGAESSTFFLPKLVGLRRAIDIAFLNPRLSAKGALELGLISAVYPDERFDDGVASLARSLASGPTLAYASAKRLMNEAAGAERLDHHLDRELELLVASADSADFKEGIRSFFEKRPPRFQGG